MRYKFIILFLFISFVSKAQVYQLMPQYGYNTFRMNFDSTIQIPTFCGVPKLGSNVTKKGALAFDSCNNRFYFFNPKLQVWDTIKSADANLFVKYTDTASLVAPYLRKGDTIFLSQRIDQRVKYSDTSLMLLPYLRVVDTTNKWVNSVTKLNDSTIQVIKGTTTSNITISSVSSATRLITQVWNNTGATILRGSVVYISGRHSSNLPTIALAQGNNEANSYKTFALVDGDIADNSSGFVIQAGKITGLNLPTSSYTDGDILYLSPTVAGGYTITKPLAPYHICKLGSVTRAHPTQGSIEIKIENGWQLDELSDVQIAAIPLDSTILQFSRIDSLWHDVNPTTAMGNRFVKSTDSAAMLQPYLRKSDTLSISNRINTKLNISDTANTWVTSVFRKTASDSVFFIRGGSNNFAFRDSAGGGNIYNTDGSLTGARTLTLNSQPLTISGTTPNRFHANGNMTFGAISTSGVSNTDSTYKLSLVGDGNYLRFRRSGIASDDLQCFFGGGNSSTNISSLSRILQIGSSSNIATFGAGTGTRTIIGTNNSDALTQVLIGYGIFTSGFSSSAILDIRSTTQGFLRPRMTTTQMNAISTPATGLSVFNTTDSSNYVYRGSGGGWSALVNATGTQTIAGSKTFSSSLATTGITGTTLNFTGNGAFGNPQIAIGGSGGFGGGTTYWVGTSAPHLTLNTSTNNGGIQFIGDTRATNSYGGNSNAFSTVTPTQNFSAGITSYHNQFKATLNATGNALANTMYNRGFFVESGTLTPNSTTLIPIGFENQSGTNLLNSTSGSTLIGGQFGTLVATAKLQVESTTQGFLPPRMTTTQRDLIATPAAGLIIYNTTTNKHQGYNGTTWNDFY